MNVLLLESIRLSSQERSRHEPEEQRSPVKLLSLFQSAVANVSVDLRALALDPDPNQETDHQGTA